MPDTIERIVPPADNNDISHVESIVFEMLRIRKRTLTTEIAEIDRLMRKEKRKGLVDKSRDTM